MTAPPTVVFLCVRNAGRSQMAAAWARHLGGDSVVVRSGGSRPGESVHPEVIEAMAEAGMDVAGAVPRRWTDSDLEAADVVVTMGCGDECPLVPGTLYEDWDVPDPGGAPPEVVRAVRDDLEGRVRGLLHRLGVPVG